MNTNSSQVQIFDTTLRDGEQSPGASLNVDEKVEIARQLVRLGVDVIEAGFPVSSPGDFEAVRRVAAAVGDRAIVCGLTRAVPKDIDVAWDALKGAARPRIHTGLGVSESHLKHKLKKTGDEALAIGVAAVKHAKSLGCEDIEYFTEDSGRADPEYLYRVIEAVIKAGATVINVPDTTGYMSPEEYGALFAGAAYGATLLFKWPLLFFYGFIGGIGNLPHNTIPTMIGALLGRYYFAKRFGLERWQLYTPVLLAGFACGTGLIGMAAIALALIAKTVNYLPF